MLTEQESALMQLSCNCRSQDDLGYNEMGFMNETRGLISPNLDELAQKDGVILKNYYVQPICSPTRSAFMT